jgi:hypothetical protein
MRPGVLPYPKREMMTIETKAPEEAAQPFMVTEEMISERDWSRGASPFYRVSEVATFFFGMSESWLRLRLRPDRDHPKTWFVRNGERIDVRRKDSERDDSERVFWLSDIEPMAWSLYRFGGIDGVRLAQILRVVEAEANLFGLVRFQPGDEGTG